MTHINIIDSHCHIHDPKFDLDLPEVLKRARLAGVTHMITVGCDVETTRQAQKRAQQEPGIYFSAGFHPHDAKFSSDEQLLEIEKMAADPNCVAIGECGLDFYYEHSNHNDQIISFIKQIKLADKLNLPLIIHLRDAYDKCLEILKEHKKPHQKFVIHCFSGNLEQAQEFCRMGGLISLSGIITFKKPGELLDVARNVPLKNLLIETDAPYLAPHPHRGQRNEPSYVTLTLKAVAQARAQNEDEVAAQLYRNTADFFNLALKAQQD